MRNAAIPDKKWHALQRIKKVIKLSNKVVS